MDNNEPKVRIAAGRLVAFLQAAYALSNPQGMGWLHAKDGPLSDEEIADLLARGERDSRGMIGMDYVNGRAVKMTVQQDADGHFIEDLGRWFDHSAGAWEELKAAATGAA